MLVHSPLEDVYDPSLIYIHWDLCEPPGGFVVPQVEAPSNHCVFSLHSPLLVGALLLSNLPGVFLSQWCINSYKKAQDTAGKKKQNKLPKRLMLARNKNRNCILTI